jgi:hypothetical protein
MSHTPRETEDAVRPFDDDLLIAELSQDPDRPAVYLAEEEWSTGEWSDDWGDEYLRSLSSPEDVVAYMQAALVAGGWTVEAPPVVAFDVPDDSDLAGVHTGADKIIHLHPKLLRPGILLHELAHWVDDREGHGPRFQAAMVSLVDAALGEAVARDLYAAYRHHGLRPDPLDLPDWASSSDS